MKNNFGQILLNLVSTNKEKFLGLLRRNGVLVNTNVSNVDLTNMLLKAMQKSETFKKEAILLMGVLMSGSNAYSNFDGVNSFNPINTSSGIGWQSKYIPTTTNETTTTTETTSTKKDFEDTTVGTILDKLFTLGNSYLTNKELDVRKAEAQAGQAIATAQASQSNVPTPPKSNTGLYVGLAIGGVALVGLLVYVIAKKK